MAKGDRLELPTVALETTILPIKLTLFINNFSSSLKNILKAKLYKVLFLKNSTKDSLF